ncbi:AI-2E family transporter [Marinicrinis lubricantis]|uniref:AI-2E family transporter n=1 Tax=Marinicrinis lubricantis TaxID=2086470 RepID=A0ABW1INA0_9BACL
MPQGKWFRIGYAIVLLLLIAYLASLVDYIFNPVKAVLGAIFTPLLLSGIIYYMMRPAVKWMTKKIPIVFSILIVYIVAAGLLFLGFQVLWTPIREQAVSLVENFPSIIRSVQKWLESVQDAQWLSNFNEQEHFNLEELTARATDMFSQILNNVMGSVTAVIEAAANFFLLIALVPFIVFYMLKDGHKFESMLLRLFPKRLHKDAKLTFQEIDTAIYSFIQGKIVTSVIVGVLVYCGYLLIGLPYAMILAGVAAITNIIPYLGPFIAGVPTVIVALTVSPLAAIEVCIILLLSNQIEGNLITPKIIGKSLNMHPLTIIILVVGGGAILGIMGMIIVVPVYAILKILFLRGIDIYRREKKIS